MNIVITDYGAGNIFSVTYALNRLGLEPVLSSNSEVISNADKVIFPGVGAAGPAMKQLKATGLDKLLPTLNQPVLGVCLGMQLMCRYSEEGDTDCLGIFDLDVKRFPPKEKVPHMGWNNITQVKQPLFDASLGNSNVYFVHSYYVEVNQHTAAVTDYILPFSAALHKDNFYACQFHPEKSGKAGEQIIANFLKI